MCIFNIITLYYFNHGSSFFEKISRVVANLTSHHNASLQKQFLQPAWLTVFLHWELHFDSLKLLFNCRRLVSNLFSDNVRYGEGLVNMYPSTHLQVLKNMLAGEKSNDPEGEADVDIIFVHGLGGSPIKTWRTGGEHLSPDLNSLYIQSWVPLDLKQKLEMNCRIISVDYVAHLWSWYVVLAFTLYMTHVSVLTFFCPKGLVQSFNYLVRYKPII
jgi:hypothetical protein